MSRYAIFTLQLILTLTFQLIWPVHDVYAAASRVCNTHQAQVVSEPATIVLLLAILAGIIIYQLFARKKR